MPLPTPEERAKWRAEETQCSLQVGADPSNHKIIRLLDQIAAIEKLVRGMTDNDSHESCCAHYVRFSSRCDCAFGQIREILRGGE